MDTDMYYGGSMKDVFINSFYLGTFFAENVTPGILLEGLRATPSEMLRKRLQLIITIDGAFKDSWEHEYSRDMSSKLIKLLLKPVHDSLMEEDIIKLIYTHPFFYNSENFSSVFKHDKAEASKVYAFYINNTDRPLDFEIYYESFSVTVSYKHILACLYDADINRLRCMLECTKLKKLKIEHQNCKRIRDSDDLVPLFQLILQRNIKIVSLCSDHNGCVEYIIQKARASMPTFTKKADNWCFQKR